MDPDQLGEPGEWAHSRTLIENLPGRTADDSAAQWQLDPWEARALLRKV